MTQTPSSTPNASDPSGIDIHRYLQVVLKRKWLILSVLVVTTGAVAAFAYTRTRIYRATATVLVHERAPQVLGAKVREVVDLNRGRFWRSREYMETQKKVITSKSLAATVARRLHLAGDPAFWGEAGAGAPQPTVDDAAGRLRGLIAARPVPRSHIIEISVRHPNPKVAARLANATAQAYIDRNVDYKLASTTVAVKWLADQLDQLKKDLEESELALYRFKRKNNILSVSIRDRRSLLALQIERLNTALTDIRIRRMALEAQRTQAARALKQDPLTVAIKIILENRTINALKATYAAERRKLQALLPRYLDRHPLVQQQRAKVASVRADLVREIRSVLNGIDSEYHRVKANEAKLAAALQSAKNDALDLNKREVAYTRLQRNKENTAKLYEMVLTRLKESDLSAQNRVNNIQMLDRAPVPGSPVEPRVRVMLGLGALAGLALGLLCAFIVESLDATVKGQAEVEAVPGLVALGMIPRIPRSQPHTRGRRPDPRPEVDLIVHKNPRSSVAESCRSIRTNLLFTSTSRKLSRIVITSPGPREGKTTTAVSLAIAMAQADSRVLLVDTDMRRPRLHKVFGVPGQQGVTSVLLGDATLDDVIKTTEVPGLYVLPCGPTPPNPAEICQREDFQALLDQLDERFDRVILDSPPVMVVTDAVVLSTISDGTLFVARSGLTSRLALREGARQVSDVGGHLLGCVVNDIDLEKRSYGYYRYRRYGYYRYGSYRYTYGQYGDKEEEAV